MQIAAEKVGTETETEGGDESSALGRACKRWMPPLFDPDNKDHNRNYSTPLGRFLMKYVPAVCLWIHITRMDDG